MSEQIACPKCGGAMVRGFIADYDHAGVNVSAWLEGPPKLRFGRASGCRSTNACRRLPSVAASAGS